MTIVSKYSFVLGLLCLALGLALAFVWIPLDTDTRIVERSRGKYVIGDGLAPTVSAVLLLISSVMLVFVEARRPSSASLSRSNLLFIGSVILFTTLGVAIMRWVGPAIVELFTDGEYRLLRDTAPWKYLGFFLGGMCIVTGMISLVERCITTVAICVGIAAVVGIILIYDLPFEDLLLPPNGDV